MTTPSDPIRPGVPVGSEKLIREGAASYVQATVAMTQFKAIVQGECEKLALGHLHQINKALGTNLSEKDLTLYQKNTFLNPQDPWICVYFTVKDVGYVWIGLYWESLKNGDYRLHAITAFQFSDQKLFQKARQKFDEKKESRFKPFPYKDRATWISLSEPIPERLSTVFPGKIQTVLDGFLLGWERIGGLLSLIG